MVGSVGRERATEDVLGVSEARAGDDRGGGEHLLNDRSGNKNS